MNKTILTGYVASDIELKTTSNGTEVSTFTIAVKRPHTKDTTDFFRVNAWRNDAKFVSTYFSKGSGIEVVGTLISKSWEDGNGNKRYSVEIDAKEVDFGKKKAEGSVGNTTDDGAQAVPAEPTFTEVKDDDDIPF